MRVHLYLPDELYEVYRVELFHRKGEDKSESMTAMIIEAMTAYVPRLEAYREELAEAEEGD